MLVFFEEIEYSYYYKMDIRDLNGKSVDIQNIEKCE